MAARKNTNGRRAEPLTDEQLGMIDVARLAHDACLVAWESHSRAIAMEKALAAHYNRIPAAARPRLLADVRAERARHAQALADAGALYARHRELTKARRAAVRRARRNGVQAVTLAKAMGVTKSRITAIDNGTAKG